MPKDYTKKLEFLIEIATLLGQQNDFQEVLRLATQKATTLLNSDMALIMMINPQTRQTLKTIYSEGKEPEERHYHFVHTNVSGWVIDNNRAFFTPDLKSDDRFRKNLFNKIQLSSAACVPLQTEGTTIGTLLLLNKDQNKKFSEDSVAILEKFAAIVSPFLRNTQKIQQYFNCPLPKQAMLRKYEAFGLLGKSKKFVQLLQAIEAASRSEVRVLLEGESGTGKELIAKAIHRLGSRNDQAFLAIDCGAIAANLIESELFGHVKGAFTGATEARKGLFEEANGGILFMDEITNLSLELQSKLLRVLQEGEIRPLGSNRSHKVDVRVIAASRTPLRKLAEQKLFREDLYYRLNVYPISVPSLDDRRQDIPLLANHFIRRFSGKRYRFHEEVLDFMKSRSWPGNIRELENFVERLVALAPPNTRVLDVSVLPPDFRKEWQKLKRVLELDQSSRSLKESLAEHEEQIIRRALMDCDWNQSKAARLLKISEHGLRYKIGKFAIQKPIDK